MLLRLFFVVACAAAATWVLLKALMPQLRYRLLDHPNSRSSHTQPTPRGGGVAFVLVSSVSAAIGWLVALSAQPGDVTGQLVMASIPLLALPLAVVGFFDDSHKLSARLRFGAQLFTSLLLILISPLVMALPSAPASMGPLGFLLSSIALTVMLIAATGVINFTNFMDGIDGLVAGCMTVVFATLVTSLAASWSLWVLVGSLLGFLLCNWSPAKVFMGDVGSTFLGAVFAGLVLQASSWQEAFGYLLVATPILGDACLCVPRRMLAGQRVFQAHSLHLFQRLHQAGWPHARVSSLYIAATGLLALALLAGGWPWVTGLAAMVFLLGFWLDQRVAVPFAVASSSLSTSPPSQAP